VKLTEVDGPAAAALETTDMARWIPDGDPAKPTNPVIPGQTSQTR
jgi:hypothetical protein